MIELISLEFNNIGRFTSKQFIDFESRDKIIQIDGINKNTGGSSGAAKSTILHALDYLLGISDIPATVLQSRLTEEPMEVTGVFKKDGNRVEIKRSKKNGLSITGIVSGSSKLGEEELDRIIGIPRKIFKKMIHKRQKENGFFLKMTPKETYEFLISVLGLDSYILKADKIADSNKNHMSLIDKLGIEIDSANASIKDLESILTNKIKPECGVSVYEINELKGRRDAFIQVINSFKEATKTELELLKAPIEPKIDLSNFDLEYKGISDEKFRLKYELDQVLSEINKQEQELKRINQLPEEARLIGLKVKSLKDQKETMESHSNCPTCKQKWTGDSAKEELNRISGEIDAYINKALNIKSQIDGKSTVESQLTAQNEIKVLLNKTYELLDGRKSMIDFRKIEFVTESQKNYLQEKSIYDIKLNMIQDRYKKNIEESSKRLSDIESNIKVKESEMKLFEIQLENYNKEIASIKQAIDKKYEEVNEKSNGRLLLQKSIIVADEARRLIKSYVIQTFQDTLDLISQTASDILNAIPNMANSTFYFEGFKESKNGSIKEEINAIINMDGENDIPIKSLSGGEETTVDLAVDLAVIDVIEAKVNKGANFLFIDEPFTGLDSVCQENYLNMIKNIDINKKIILIDHSPELKEMVPDVIKVVREGEYSIVI